MALSFFKFQISCFNVFIFFIFGGGAGAGHVRVLFIGEEKYKQTRSDMQPKLCPRHDFKPVWLPEGVHVSCFAVVLSVVSGSFLKCSNTCAVFSGSF